MSLSPWRCAAVFSALALLCGATASGQDGLHVTPAGQPPLAVIVDRDLGPLRHKFNQLSDRPRVLLMLSPT